MFERLPPLPKLGQETGMTPEERREEADRILSRKDLIAKSDGELMFIHDCKKGGFISGKMLFWLRDIAARTEEDLLEDDDD